MTFELRIDADDFELFNLPQRHAQDCAAITTRWKSLQSLVHPDRFAAGGAAAQRVAMQWSLRVNEAYRRLQDPLQRAAYLCELNGHPPGAPGAAAMPPDFLLQQMAWHEALAGTRTATQVQALAAEVARRQRLLHDELALLIDDRRDWPAAAAQVRMLMFMDRLGQDIDRRLGDAEACGAADGSSRADA